MVNGKIRLAGWFGVGTAKLESVCGEYLGRPSAVPARPRVGPVRPNGAQLGSLTDILVPSPRVPTPQLKIRESR